jgi:hypothetical protein
MLLESNALTCSSLWSGIEMKRLCSYVVRSQASPKKIRSKQQKVGLLTQELQVCDASLKALHGHKSVDFERESHDCKPEATTASGETNAKVSSGKRKPPPHSGVNSDGRNKMIIREAEAASSYQSE